MPIEINNEDFFQMVEEDRRRRHEKREAEVRREIASISSTHRLTGYDWNVLRQWEQSGFAGKRPVLAFELEEQCLRAEAAVKAQELRDRVESETLRLREEKRRLEWERKREEKRKWREENPELAAAEDAEEAARREETRRLVEQKRREEEAQRWWADEVTRVRRLAFANGPLSLNLGDFLFWCEEVASEMELQEFDEECLAESRRLERARWPWWQRLIHHLVGVA